MPRSPAAGVIRNTAFSFFTAMTSGVAVSLPVSSSGKRSSSRTGSDSFVKRDGQAARGILESDNAVDKARKIIQTQLTELMERDTGPIHRALDHLIIARSLERIADHATNVAEDVIFLAQGVDVRHRIAEVA